MHADGRQTATGFFSFSEFHPLGKARALSLTATKSGYLPPPRLFVDKRFPLELEYEYLCIDWLKTSPPSRDTD
jgi:hypothetical protein